MKLLNPSVLKERIDTRMKSDLEEGNLFGAAARVCQGTQTLYDGKFGVTGPESDTPVTDDTVYRLASMTKPITAAAVLLLKDRGLLRLEDTVESYLPEYRDIRIGELNADGQVIYTGFPQKKINIFHLLTHSSGIGCMKIGDKYRSEITEEDDRTLDNAVRYYAKTALAYEPQTCGAYSGIAGFDILARIVEIVSGQDYNRFLTENLFLPLDMNDTTFVPSENQWNRMIGMHRKIDGKACAVKMPEGRVFGNTPVTHFLGGAGLASTLPDYMNFAQMLLSEGVFRGKRILSAESVREMATPRIDMDVTGRNHTQKWGLGVRVIAESGYRRLPVGAYGWSGAYGTHFFVDPVNRIAAVYMKNSVTDGGSGAKSAANFEEDISGALEDKPC